MTTAQELLRAIRQSGATVVVEDGSLRIKAPAGRISPEDRQVIAEYKVEILSLLAEELTAPDEADDRDEDLDLVGWDQAIDPPPPCQQCGGLWHWWDLLGGRHCSKCEPTVRSDLLVAKAARLRRRAGRSVSHAALAKVGPDRLTCRR